MGGVKSALGKGLGIGAGLAVAAPLLDPVIQGAAAEVGGGERMRAAAGLLQQQQDQRVAVRARFARVRQDIAVNTQRLAQFSPQLYASLMAGQELPEGGVAIGGEPNTDLVQQVAYMMSKGTFQQE